MPHGVLFRGNAEADIRRNLIRHGYIQAIIGLPANLFYGTGIPACIIVIDKAEAQARKGIFMMDASGGFMKDGPKNRLRERDIHRIVDVFTQQAEVPKYARMVGLDEIERNDFNLNLPRYIDASVAEDRQDMAGHLYGGIPAADVDALQAYWDVCPQLRQALFTELRPGYLGLQVDKTAIKTTIYQHPEFAGYVQRMNQRFADWQAQQAPQLQALQPGFHPKQLIENLSEHLLAHYRGQPLVDAYAVYQHLMDYWDATLQDDAYLIAADGWKAVPYRVLEHKKNKEGQVTKTVDKGWACDLLPKPLIVARYFFQEQAAIDELTAHLDSVTASITELEEEHSGEDAVFSGYDKINQAEVNARLKEIKGDPDAEDERKVLNEWLKLTKAEADLKKQIKAFDAALDAQALAQYPQLTTAEIQSLVVEDKWMASLRSAIAAETDRTSQTLTQRIKELADRYDTPVPELTRRVAELEAKVNAHLAQMGFAL